MDTLLAWNKGEANRHRPLMVFDWNKAAQLIREKSPRRVSAGLSGDWEWTGGSIYTNGEIVPREQTYTFLASTWATPEICFDDGEPVPCFVMQSETNGWDSDTYWPESALKILQGQ